MKTASRLIRCILPLVIASPVVNATVISGGAAPDLAQAQFTHPGYWQTSEIDLLASLPPGTTVSGTRIARITPGGKVLLAVDNQPLTVSAPGPRLLGYIWDQGNLTPVYSPVWPWIYTDPELFEPGVPEGEGGQLSFTLTDLNDRGEIVGLCFANDWANQRDLIPYEERIGVIWPAGVAGPAQAINPGIASPLDRYNLYKDWFVWSSPFYRTSIDRLYIDKDGKCYGRATVELNFDAQSWADYHYDVVKWEDTDLPPANLTNNAALFNAGTISDNAYSEILSLSPNGNLLFSTTRDSPGPVVTYGAVLSDGVTNTLLSSTPEAPPSLITDAGLAVGFGGQSPSVWADGSTPSLLTGYFNASSESGDILSPTGSRIWLRRNSAQGDYYIPVTTASTAPFVTDAATRQITNGLFAGGQSQRPTLRIPACLVVDEDRDGILRSQADATSAAELPVPDIYRFWSNDDDDGIYTDSMESEEDDLNVTDSSKEDWRDNVIDSPRDLEDFARLHLYVGGLHEAFRNGNLYLGLKWTDTNGTSPSIKLYRATSPADNDTAYLAEGDAANRQSLEAAIIDARYPAYSGGNFQSDHTQIGTSGFFVLPSDQALLLTEQNPTLRFIFEGCTTGKGQLKLVILKKENGTYTEIGDGPGVWLDIKKPHEFIQRWTCGDGSLATVQPVQFDAAKSGTFAAPTKDEEKDLVLYVHGYNMQADWEKQRWIETTFKRLYGLGYKGRVGGFVWPCVLDGPSQFNASEERAWQAGEQLKALLQQLKGQGYRVHVLGHSQGNVVVSEALRQAGPNSGLVSTYVASQAALAVHGYDASQPDRSGPIAFTPSTPNVYSRYWTWLQDPNLPETWGSGSPSYFAPTYIQGAADKFINFYNPLDYALRGNGANLSANDGSQPGWLFNQRLKPWIGYDYASYIGFRESPLTNFSPRLFRFPDDRFDIFSYGAQARSIALGAGASGGVFNTNVNLEDAPTNFSNHHVFHSGQFRSNYAYRWAYWWRLMDACQLLPRATP